MADNRRQSWSDPESDPPQYFPLQPSSGYIVHDVDERTPTATSYPYVVPHDIDTEEVQAAPSRSPSLTNSPTRFVERTPASENQSSSFRDRSVASDDIDDVQARIKGHCPLQTPPDDPYSRRSTGSQPEDYPPLGLFDSSTTLDYLAMSSQSTAYGRREESKLKGQGFSGGSQDDDQPEDVKHVKMKLPETRDGSPSRFGHRREDSDVWVGSSALTSPSGTDYEGSSDEYDWSGEEDLADEAGKYVEMTGQKPKKTGWNSKRLFNLAFSSLIGSTLTAAFVALPAILVHFYWYKPNPTEHRKYVTQNVEAWLFWAAANIVISWYLAMIIDVVPVIVRYFLSIVWGHVSERVKSRIEMYEAVKGSFKPAFYAGSLLASWVIIFAHIYHLYNEDEGEDSPAPYTDRAYQVVVFFFFFVICRCIQKMVLHYVALNFHHAAYKDRIEEVEECLSIIEKLQQYRPKKNHQKTPSGARTPKMGSSNLNRLSATYNPYDMQDLNHRLYSLMPRPPPLSRLASEMKIPTGNSSDGGNDGDIEEGDGTLLGSSKARRNKKEKNTGTWFNFGETRPEAEAIGLRELALDQQRHPEAFDGHAFHKDTERNDFQPTMSRDSTEHLRASSPTVQHSSQHGGDVRWFKGAHSEGSGDGAIAQAAKVFKKAVLHDARNITGGDPDTSSLSWNINSSTEAKRLAKSLFKRLKDRRRKYLVAGDFHPAFPTHKEAEEAFHVFDVDKNGDLTRAELKRTLVKTYLERRFLSRSLKDAGEALKSLGRILLVLALVVLFFISLSVFGVEVGTSLTSLYSIGIAASFIFKSSASRAFDAIMFLFVTHPYDTGDRVFVDNENLVVKKMGLFATTFNRSDGTETYYFNSQLFTKFITNARRSGKTTETLTMQVAWKTPLTKLDALQSALNEWLSTEENRWYQPETGVTLQHIVYQRYLELTIGISHNGNWQDWGLRNARKTAFHAAVQYYCQELGIIGYEAPLPVVFNEPSPNTPMSPMDRGHTDGDTSVAEQKVSEEIEEAAKNAKPSLGFLPPLPERSNRLARARKSHRSKGNALQAMNAEFGYVLLLKD